MYVVVVVTDDGDGCDCGGSGGSHSVGSDRSAYDGGHADDGRYGDDDMYVVVVVTDDGDDCDCGGSGGSHSVGSDRSAYDGGHADAGSYGDDGNHDDGRYADAGSYGDDGNIIVVVTMLIVSYLYECKTINKAYIQSEKEITYYLGYLLVVQKID
jgi:hypothetical protein